MVPMIRKELQQRMRDRRAWLLPTVYLLALGGVVAVAYYGTVGGTPGRHEVQGAEIGQALFMSVTITQMAVLLLIAPAFSAGGLTIEKEQRTLAGLLTSLLGPKDIWWGKFVASFLFVVVLLVSALPMLSLSFAFGGVSPGQVMLATGVTLLVLAAICSVSLWCSSLFRRSVHATAASYGIIIALTVLTFVIHMILTNGNNKPFENEDPWKILPLLLNPFFPLAGTYGAPLRERFYWGASLLLFTAVGCLAAAGAMRNIARSGEQV